MKIQDTALIALLALFMSACVTTREHGPGELMKGIAYRQLEPEGMECTDMEKLNVSWYYNWTPVPNCPYNADLEFIPMIWSEKYLVNDNYEKFLVPLKGSEYSALLGYNEPNWLGQAEMSVETALEYWPMLEETGLRLGSPATTGRSGLDWSIEFMKGAKERGYHIEQMVCAISWITMMPSGCQCGLQNGRATSRIWLPTLHS